MIYQITETIRMSTEPLNWVVQELKGTKWENKAFLERLDQAKNVVLSRFTSPAEEETVLIKFTEFAKELGLNELDKQSAWVLTNEVKHPEFIKKLSPRSLNNLKPRRIPSKEFAS